jgi:hypothetical protein
MDKNTKELLKITLALDEIMEKDNVIQWLITTNPNLRGQSPYSLIKDGSSCVIWDIMNEVKQGAFL